MASIKSFLLKLGIFSFLTLFIPVLWQQYMPERFQTNTGWFVWVFFIAVTLLIHTVLLKAADESSKKFIVFFMGITGIKLFLYLIILLVYGMLKGKAALGFILLFLIFYFLYTAFEIVSLLRRFRK